MPQLRSPLQSTSGGMMTVEAGAVTGDLELSTTPVPGGADAKVRYAGERYVVAGSPVPPSAFPEPGHSAVRWRILRLLTMPGPVEPGNEMPVGLGREPRP